MNLVSSLHIEGLWGHLSFQSNFDEKINYIIGTNGTGKTTIINLIAAALTADHQKLDKIDFSKIEITLKSTNSLRKPKIIVIKERVSLSPLGIVDNVNINKFYKRVVNVKDYTDDIKYHLENFVKVSWLSVHRYDIADKDRLNEIELRQNFTSSIDRKLFTLNNELVRFFSLLSQKFTEHTLEFQKKSFLAMLHQEGVESIFTFSRELDIVKEKKTLNEIFDILGVEKRLSDVKLKSHFDKLSKIQDRKKFLAYPLMILQLFIMHGEFIP
ncbi:MULTISPECIES: ATP-binding protein [Aeromonas]|uniref:ATP-binding protein n=1 Tax=Aeromonas TaxID=642 RepID=UPI0012F19D48